MPYEKKVSGFRLTPAIASLAGLKFEIMRDLLIFG